MVVVCNGHKASGLGSIHPLLPYKRDGLLYFQTLFLDFSFKKFQLAEKKYYSEECFFVFWHTDMYLKKFITTA